MGSVGPQVVASGARAVLTKLLVVGLFAGGIALGVSAAGPADPVVVSPMATVDDVYAALTTAMGGETPDFDTQVQPVLDRNLTYRQLQDLVKSGGLADILAATAAPSAHTASVVTAAPAITAAPAPSVAPSAARTVAMTAVMTIIRSQWDSQPQPICTRGGTPCVNHSPLASLSCDRTGDIAVPAKVSCTYTDPLTPDPAHPGTLAVVVDANNAVIWGGCSTDPGTHFWQLCLQAAPTPAPAVAPAGNVTPSYCGQEWITVSILDGRPHPVWIYIDGRGPLGPNIVNTYRVIVGTHTVYWFYNDGTRSPNDNVYVPTCGYALIKLN